MGLFSKLLRKAIVTPERTGQIGESRIAAQLSITDLFGKPGRVLRNVYIPKGNNQTTEIDLLYITQKGIFVIESKNYSGYIFGGEQNRNWTVTLYNGKSRNGRSNTEKHQFYNPIKQNQAHIKALSEYLHQNIPFFSIIVFSNRCELKNVPTQLQKTYICQRSNLSRVISDIWDSYLNYFSEQEVDSLHARMLHLTRQDASVKQQHIKNAQAASASDFSRNYNRSAPSAQQTIAPAASTSPSQPSQPAMLCPHCGRKLVLRTAKQGAHAGNRFWGCSGYPNCKYILPHK